MTQIAIPCVLVLVLFNSSHVSLGGRADHGDLDEAAPDVQEEPPVTYGNLISDILVRLLANYLSLLPDIFANR